MTLWMMYLAIDGGIALVTALGIAYEERVVGITFERREHNAVRREQAAPRTDKRTAIDKLTRAAAGGAAV